MIIFKKPKVPPPKNVIENTILKAPELNIPKTVPLGKLVAKEPMIAGWVGGQTFDSNPARYVGNTLITQDSSSNGISGIGCTTNTGWGDLTPEYIEIGDNTSSSKCFDTNPTTLVWMGRIIDTTHTSYLISSGSTYYDEMRFSLSITTINKPVLQAEDSFSPYTWYFTNLTLDDRTENFVIVLTYDGSTYLNCYIKGASEQKVASSASFPDSANDYPIIINAAQIAFGNPASYYGEKTHVKLACVFPREFSEQEAIRTVEDPMWLFDAAI